MAKKKRANGDALIKEILQMENHDPANEIIAIAKKAMEMATTLNGSEDALSYFNLALKANIELNNKIHPAVKSVETKIEIDPDLMPWTYISSDDDDDEPTVDDDEKKY